MIKNFTVKELFLKKILHNIKFLRKSKQMLMNQNDERKNNFSEWVMSHILSGKVHNFLQLLIKLDIN